MVYKVERVGYNYRGMGDFDPKVLKQYAEECRKPRKKSSAKQKEQGKELAKDYGFQNQTPQQRKTAGKKGGQSERKKKPECPSPKEEEADA